MRQRSSTRKKGDTELEREKKNKGDIFFVGRRQHENFVAVVRKWEMLAAIMVKMSGTEKKNSQQEHLRHFLRKTCN